MQQFSFTLLTPSGEYFSGTIWQISARTTSGMFAVRAHHEPLTVSLPPGPIEIAEMPDKRKKITISEGVLTYTNNSCTILCEGINNE